VYIPEHFRMRHHEDAVSFMRVNPFAILISTMDDCPFATHLPLFVRTEGEKVILHGHVARANPHWRYLEKHPECLTIFHGAHSYISPSLYANRESVPTWNYAAVHLCGNARVFSSPEDLLGVLHELMSAFEPAYAEQWASLDEAFRQRMLSHIVGFEITATKIEGKFKLSQNRTREDQANVIASLEKAEDTAVSGVSRLMRDLGLGEDTTKKDRE
jgi:transcriptional regulator